MKSKILLVMLVLVSLLAAGCNEEEKYNTAKNEYQQMREEISRLELTTGEIENSSTASGRNRPLRSTKKH